MSDVKPYIIGLTGTIGSGKSECSRILRENFGLPIVDADEIAAEVVSPGSEGLELIKREFGDEYVLENGEYNRKLMGSLVSRDKDALNRLNSLLHPLIKKRKMEHLEALKGEPIVVYDCPLLFEAGEDSSVDEILLITVSEAERLKRIMERDGLSEEEAQARVAMQMDDESKAAKSDSVIVNDGTLEQLESALDFFLKNLKKGLAF